MAIIKKKIWPEYFELVKSGKKTFELRLADFKIQEGDILILEEWDPRNKKYTGRKLKRKVKYILKFHLDNFGQKKEIKKKGFYVGDVFYVVNKILGTPDYKDNYMNWIFQKKNIKENIYTDD